jgi:hypothetical protein
MQKGVHLSRVLTDITHQLHVTFLVLFPVVDRIVRMRSLQPLHHFLVIEPHFLREFASAFDNREIRGCFSVA